MEDDNTSQTAVADDEWEYKPKAKAQGDDEWDYKPAQKASTLAPGSYQTKPGGPVLNTATTPPIHRLDEESGLKRGAGAFNEAVGAPRTLREAPSTLKEMGKSALLASNPITAPFEAYRQLKRIYQPMKETSEYADQFPAGSSAYLYNKGLSAVPIIGPAIAGAARKGAEDPEGLRHAAPEMAGTAIGTGLGLAMGDPEARNAIGEIPGKIGSAINTGRRALAEKVVSPLVYENLGETTADVRTGINPERGVTREGLVGTKAGLAEQAETRTAELKQAANNILRNHRNSNVRINAGPMIDAAIDNAIEQTQKVAGSTERLENLREALKTRYGPIEGVPLEINSLKSDIQEAAAGVGAYRNTQPVEASLASAMGDAARRIKDAVNEQIPEAAELNQRMADLIDARKGLTRNVLAERGRPIFGNLHGGLTTTLLNRTAGSAPVRSGIARSLMLGLTEGVPEPLPSRPRLGYTPTGTPLGTGEADTSGAVRGGRYTTPRGLVGEEPPIEAEFIPRRVTIHPERLGIGRMLPERTGPESTIPPDVEEPFRREGTGTIEDERTLAGQKGIRQPVRGLLLEAAGQAPPKEPIGRPIPVNRGATIGRKGLKGGINVRGAEQSLRPTTTEQRVQALRDTNADLKEAIRNKRGSEEERSQAQQRIEENDMLIAELEKKKAIKR